MLRRPPRSALLPLHDALPIYIGQLGGVIDLGPAALLLFGAGPKIDRKSTRLNSSHRCISYAVLCLKKSCALWDRKVNSGYRVGVPETTGTCTCGAEF